MAVNSYSVGDRARCSVQFTDMGGLAADPTTVVAKYKAPAGTVTTKTYGDDEEVVKAGTGFYYIDVDLSAAGEWYYRFNGTGAVVAAGEQLLRAAVTQF